MGHNLRYQWDCPTKLNNLNGKMLLRSGRVSGHQIEEDQCPICLDLVFKPTKLHPCSHIFCDPCIRKVRPLDTTKSIMCPICRSEILDCSRDLELENIMDNTYSKEMSVRKRCEQ